MLIAWKIVIPVASLFATLLISDGIIGIQLKNSLQQVATSANSLKTNLLAGDFVTAENDKNNLVDASHKANALALSFPWVMSQWIPFIGPNFAATSDLAYVSVTLADEVLSPGMDLFQQLQEKPPITEDGRISIDVISSWENPITQISSGIEQSLQKIDQTPSTFLIPQITEAKDKVSDLLLPMRGPLESLQTLFPLIPNSLGAGAPRNYLLVFQNPAEMRPQGGLPGSIVLLQLNNRKISLVDKSSAGTDIFGAYEAGVIPISPERDSLFPYSNYIMANATTTPSFSEAALKTTTFWENAGKGEIDGVIFIDPRALAYVMAATGPEILSNGVSLESSNAVSYLLNGIYFYSDDNTVQDGIYGELVDQVFGKLTSGQFSPIALAAALGQGIQEGRVSYWSAHPEEQAVFSGLNVGLEPPTLSSTKAGVSLFLEDNQGSKMDYYLTQSVDIQTAECSTSSQEVVITYQLTNNLPLELAGNLPNSIWATSSAYVQVPGGIRANTYLYMPPKALLLGMKIDGVEAAPDIRADGPNPVIKTNIQIAPQQSRTVEVIFELPAGKMRTIDFKMTPLSSPSIITKQLLQCLK
jgi:hypothetical protein